MKIGLLTVGSRGDVQPFVALGQGLQAAGHQVTVCTSSSFAPFIEAHGLAYGYMNDGIVQFIDSDAARKAMEEADNIVSWVKTAVSLTKDIKPVYRRMLDEAWQALADVDAILYHPKAVGGYHIAEKLNIPGFLVLPAPLLVPTAEFPLLVFPELPLGGWYNRFTYATAPVMAQASIGSAMNGWRQQTLGMPKHRITTSELTRSDGRPVPVLHCYSEHVLPQPADWPATAVTPGFWFLDRDEGWQPPEELQAFLDAGPPPVYVGFGSISGKNPAKTARAVIEGLQGAGQRGIIATGWGGLQADSLPAEIFKIDAVPHDWLFPQMAAVVHHGGAGTTAAGLRAGKPTIVCPFFGDQPFWGKRVAALGVGPEPVPQKKLTATRLAEAIKQAVSDIDMQQRAAQLGERLRAEDGVKTAVHFIESHLA